MESAPTLIGTVTGSLPNLASGSDHVTGPPLSPGLDSDRAPSEGMPSRTRTNW